MKLSTACRAASHSGCSGCPGCDCHAVRMPEGFRALVDRHKTAAVPADGSGEGPGRGGGGHIELEAP